MESAEAHFKKAWQLRRDKRWQEAIAEFQASLEFLPDHAATHFNLGQVYEKVGDLKKAAFHMKQARDLFLAKNDSHNQNTAQRLLDLYTQ